MARLTKADAARQLGIARATLYKLIAQGKVSPTSDGLIDQAELVRVAPYIDTLHERTRTPTDSRERLQTSTDTAPISPRESKASASSYRLEGGYERLQTDVHERLQTATAERSQTSTDTLVDILREQLQVLREELQEARQSAQAARDRETLMLQMLHDMQHRYDRLLDMPRSAAMPPRRPQDAPGATQAPPAPHQVPGAAPTHPGDPRGTMRRRIVALLQDYPEGLTTGEMRDLLGVDRSLADTLLGMRKYGLVQRVERGRYVAATPNVPPRG